MSEPTITFSRQQQLSSVQALFQFAFRPFKVILERQSQKRTNGSLGTWDLSMLSCQRKESTVVNKFMVNANALSKS
jgi:hypothetical protein